MKILLVHQYYMKNMDVPGGARWNEMTKVWVQQGHKITVIASMYDIATGRKLPGYKGKIFKHEKLCDGLDADRVEWTGKHLAYDRSPWNVTHTRKITVEKQQNHWEIEDELAGNGIHELELRWHLPSEAKIIAQQPEVVRLQIIGPWRLEVSESGETKSELLKSQPNGGFQSLYYGQKTTISTLSVKKHCHLPATFKTIVWKEAIQCA